MAKEEKYEPPEQSVGDTVHLVASGAMSFIPGLSELFGFFIAPPLEKRRTEWMDEIGKALRDLEKNRGVVLEDLQDNDVFVDTVLHATQIAFRNSQREKRQALRNAVVNAALPNPPEESLQLMFLALVDAFTVWHLRLLHLFQSPKRWFVENNRKLPSFAMSCSIAEILIAAYPELGTRRSFYDLVIDELIAKGLFAERRIHTLMNATGAFEKRITKLGDRFLQFITDSGE